MNRIGSDSYCASRHLKNYFSLNSLMIILVTGVSGTGKTTIGQKLANYYQLPFYDADKFHPAVILKR